MSERPGIKNLRPVKSVEEAREKGRKGGIKSGKVRREKKLLSQLYAEMIADMYDIEKTDKENISLRSVVKSVLKKGGSPAVAMLKAMGELTEGQKMKLSGGEGQPVKFEYVAPPEKTDDASTE